MSTMVTRTQALTILCVVLLGGALYGWQLNQVSTSQHSLLLDLCESRVESVGVFNAQQEALAVLDERFLEDTGADLAPSVHAVIEDRIAAYRAGKLVPPDCSID